MVVDVWGWVGKFGVWRGLVVWGFRIKSSCGERFGVGVGVKCFFGCSKEVG